MDNIEAIINHHSQGSYTVPESGEVTSFAALEARKAAAQERFDTIGLPRCLTPIAGLR